jgi:PKD repeat protein
LLALLLVGVVSLAYARPGIAETVPAVTGGSWNPNVNCVPVVTTLENIIGTNLNSFNGGLLAGNQYATYNLKYYDQNGNGSFLPGDPVVYDMNNNGVADVTPGKNDQFYSASNNATDRNLSTSPTSLVSGFLIGQPLKTDMRLKYIDGSTGAFYGNTTNGNWDLGNQTIGETVVFDANDNNVVDINDMVVSGGVRTPSSAEIGKPLLTQTFGGIFNKRMLNPPCTITNTAGQVVGVFVEIHGVYPENWEYNTEDCATVFNGVNGGGNYNGTLCDSTGDMQTFGFQGYCGSGTYTACNHRIHFEIDQDWMAKGWCGPAISYCNNSTLLRYVASGISPGSTSIDVQGFIYWDPTEVTTQGHMYSGWEIHPFTAWRLSASLRTSIKDSADNPVTSVIAGTTVHDTAIISYGSGAFTGMVTYNFFAGSTCGGTATIVGSPVAVTNGIVQNSASQTFNAAGSFSWNAVYSGDPNNNGGTSPCEPLAVNKSSPIITTTLSANPITVGGSVTDSAALSSSFQAGGTVTYLFFTGPTCTGTGTQVGDPVAVTNGAIPTSTSQTFNTAGNFSWNAVYSGDSNNDGSASTCEPLTVNPTSGVIVTTTLSTNNITFGGSVSDSATLTGVTTNAGGSVTYNIFPRSTCAGPATPVGSPVRVTNGVVPKSGSQTFNSPGSFSWNVAYTGDANNNGATGACEPLTVNEPIMVNFAFSPTKHDSGRNIAFSGIATGGTLPYASWSWNFGDNSPASFGATVAHSYPKAGPYIVRLTVVDNSGISATSTTTILILENRTILGLAPILFYEIMVGLGVAVAATAIALYWRRTRAHLYTTARDKF